MAEPSDLPDPHADPTRDAPIPVVRGGRTVGTHNAANPKHVAAARKKAEATQARRDSDLRLLLTMPEGRRILWWLLERAGTFQRPEVYSAQIHWLQGRAALGMEVWDAIETVNPSALIEMMVVAKQEKELDA